MTLRVGTYNILHGADFEKKRKTGEDTVDLSLASRAITEMDLDICALNEVRNQENVEGLCNQAKKIADRVGCYYLFARAIDHAGGEYGNALLSRYPILSSTLHPIIVPKDKRVAARRYENRVALEAHLDIHGKTVAVIVTHFGLHRDEIDLAAETVVKIVKNSPYPTIVMGDFNVSPDDDAIKKLKSILVDTADLTESPLLTFPSHAPDIKIDYIMTTRDLTAISIDCPNILTSDHKPLTAEIELA